MSLGNQFGRVARFFIGTAPRRFASVSVLLALVSAIAPTKDLFSQWRHYQRLYVQLIRNRPDAARLEKRFQSWHSSDMDSRAARGRSLLNLPRGPAGTEPGRCAQAALSPASSDAALAHRIRMCRLPSRAGSSHHRRRGALQHEGVGAADSAGPIPGVILRPVPHGCAGRNAPP